MGWAKHLDGRAAGVQYDSLVPSLRNHHAKAAPAGTGRFKLLISLQIGGSVPLRLGLRQGAVDVRFPDGDRSSVALSGNAQALQ